MQARWMRASAVAIVVGSALACGGIGAAEEPATVTIRVLWPGLSAEQVEARAGLPLETALASTNDLPVASMTVISVPGRVSLELVAEPGVSPEDLMLALRDPLSAATNGLDAPTPPLVEALRPQRIGWLGLEHLEAAHHQGLRVVGAPVKELQIRLDPARLAALGVTAQQLRDTLHAADSADPSDLANLLLRPGVAVGDVAEVTWTEPLMARVERAGVLGLEVRADAELPPDLPITWWDGRWALEVESASAEALVQQLPRLSKELCGAAGCWTTWEGSTTAWIRLEGAPSQRSLPSTPGIRMRWHGPDTVVRSLAVLGDTSAPLQRAQSLCETLAARPGVESCWPEGSIHPRFHWEIDPSRVKAAGVDTEAVTLAIELLDGVSLRRGAGSPRVPRVVARYQSDDPGSVTVGAGIPLTTLLSSQRQEEEWLPRVRVQGRPAVRLSLTGSRRLSAEDLVQAEPDLLPIRSFSSR